MGRQFGTSYSGAQSRKDIEVRDFMNKLIYSFKEHGLYYEQENRNINNEITLTIGTLLLEFEYLTGELFNVKGYLPLIKSEKGKLSIPPFKDEFYSFKTKDIEYHSGVAYDLFNLYPESQKYFMNDEYNPKLVFDENGKKILIGTSEKYDYFIKINSNVICGFDDNTGVFKSILILINEIQK